MRFKPLVDPDAGLWNWLAYDLRFYRQKYRLSQNALAEIIKTSPPNLSNLEAGRRRLKDEQAEALDERFTTGGHFQRLLRYARLGHDPNWFKQYMDLEAEAIVIKAFEPIVVPGLLQTPEYATAIIEAAGAPDVDALVKTRMQRQAVLRKDSPPTLWVVLTQTVIDWPVGDGTVMRDQLAYLLEVSARPNVGLRVIPRTAGAHAGSDGSIYLISGERGDVAYIEAPGGGRLVPSLSEVRKFELVYDRIGQSALPEKQSRLLIEEAMEAL
ncbi:helix-turn-helix transcriptional regulator [Actinoallomurus purpureus]|uniref:helix-turn-helix domain-containing protein n=1 Tax=Actinoallomurus purpureus TaxID=478114 RepID=UPI0020935267|nr:helix-turn-helix transcriptional regulator [Actinoallomurus purpureus]MCO6010968.1 helix-turn-helix transcriptional regulator [Actinoallomurus purpureus]